MVRGDHRQAIEHADRALALAAQLGLPEPARALGFRGSARIHLGDAAGLQDMRKARDAAIAQGLGRDVAVIYCNLASNTLLVEGPRQRLELAREGSRFARRRGIQQHVVITARALLAEQRGQHAEAADLFAAAASRWEQFEVPWERAQALLGQGRCLLALGRPAEARPLLTAARDVLASLGARIGLAETCQLLAQAADLAG